VTLLSLPGVNVTLLALYGINVTLLPSDPRLTTSTSPITEVINLFLGKP
jgi:hypothetical protein